MDEARALLVDLLGRDCLRAGLPETRSGSLADWLVGAAGTDDDRRAALTDAIGRAAALLTPDDRPPTSELEAEAWRALVSAAGRLHGFGAAPLRRLPFVSGRLLEVLAAEGRAGLPSTAAERRAVAPPGSMLTNLALSRKLRDAVATALNLIVVPTGDAIYEYDPPGTHVATHVDSRSYEIVFHLVIEHTSGTGPAVSELVVHRPDAPEPDRVVLRAGDGVALRGRGTIHSWRPLGSDESRLLVAIGFATAAGT